MLRALARRAASVVYVLATCFSQPRKLVTDMNVQAFFQQTSSRVLYTMTSKAHGYGVEEAITSSEGSDGGVWRRIYDALDVGGAAMTAAAALMPNPT